MSNHRCLHRPRVRAEALSEIPTHQAAIFNFNRRDICMDTIGLIGLGNMGLPVAKRLRGVADRQKLSVEERCP